MGVSAAFLIMSFYSEVAAWVFAYIFKAASGGSSPPIPPSRGCLQFAHHGSLAESALAVAGAGLMGILLMGSPGDRSGRQAVDATALHPAAGDRRAQPGLCPGARRRTAFPVLAGFLQGDRRRRADGHGAGVLQALSIGMGCMMTYGSYFCDDQHILSPRYG